MLKRFASHVVIVLLALVGSLVYIAPAKATPNFPSNAMVLEYELPDSADDSDRTVGLYFGGGVNITIDWGDGSNSSVNTGGLTEHIFARPAGTVYVQITGDANTFGNVNQTPASNRDLVRVHQWGALNSLSDISGAFKDAPNLMQVPTTVPASITVMGFLFMNDISFNQDLTGWDTHQVRDMQSMFAGATSYNSPLPQTVGGWNTSSVTSFAFMFAGATSFNQPVDTWDVSSALSLDSMFARDPVFNQPVGMWDVSNVETMNATFAGATSFNQPLGNWDVSSVWDFQNTFAAATVFNQDISNWNTSQALLMGGMFANLRDFNQPLDAWDVSRVITMPGMFQGTSAFNQSLNSWNVGNVTNMGAMFDSATAFNGNISSWDVADVTNFGSMFSVAEDFNRDIGRWNMGSATDTSYMFHAAYTFNQPLGNWDVSHVDNMEAMFQEAWAFNQNLNSWNVGNVQNFSSTFVNARSFNQPLSDWNTSRATNMSLMFSGASSFNQDVSTWDTSSVTNMAQMFRAATAYNMPMVSRSDHWETGNVRDMSWMFKDATSFNQPLDSWYVGLVTNMSYMFNGATAFDMDLSSWDTTFVTDMSEMFVDSNLQPAHYSAFVGAQFANSSRQQNVTLTASSKYLCWVRGDHYRLIDDTAWSIADGGEADCALTTQTLNFFELDAVAHNNNLPINKAVRLAGAATSGLPLSFKWISGPCTVTGTSLRANAGSLGKKCIIAAQQHGNASYSDAVQVLHTMTVTAAVQTSYSVIYESNGADRGTIGDAAHYSSGNRVPVLGQGNLVRAGYTFAGWNTQTDGSGLNFQPGSEVNVGEGDVVLFANWQRLPSYRVIFALGAGDSGSLSDVSGTANSVTLPAFSTGTMTKNGYRFTGWLGDNGVSYADAQALTLSGAFTQTLTAQWAKDDSVAKPKFVTATISGFVAGSALLKSSFKKSIRAFVAANPRSTVFTCTGYTTTEPKLATDRRLGLARATSVCNYLKSLRPGSISTLKAVRPTSASGAANRKVVIRLAVANG